MSVTLLPQIRVTDYESCREFLAAYHAAVKEKNPRWSLSAWAKKLGLPTGSSLAKILSGKRAIVCPSPLSARISPILSNNRFRISYIPAAHPSRWS